jgi:hypothetical protein
MTAYKHSMTSLAQVRSTRISRGRVSGGDEGTPPLTMRAAKEAHARFLMYE